MSEDLELTMAKEECTPTQYYPDQIGYVPNEEKPKRQMAKLYAVIVASDSQFDCVVVADDKKDLQAKINKLEQTYSDKDMTFSITALIKGHEVQFRETKTIEFI
jgi:hypothetical protein